MEREYIGIDLHKAFFQVCAVTASGERQWEQRWPTTDLGIAGLLAGQTVRQARRLVRGYPLVVEHGEEQ